MREAVKTGRANGSSLALLEDRVAIGEGRPQIYGSQLYQEGDGPLIVQAMEDPDHVDERRASIGLPLWRVCEALGSHVGPRRVQETAP